MLLVRQNLLFHEEFPEAKVMKPKLQQDIC